MYNIIVKQFFFKFLSILITNSNSFIPGFIFNTFYEYVTIKNINFFNKLSIIFIIMYWTIIIFPLLTTANTLRNLVYFLSVLVLFRSRLITNGNNL